MTSMYSAMASTLHSKAAHPKDLAFLNRLWWLCSLAWINTRAHACTLQHINHG